MIIGYDDRGFAVYSGQFSPVPKKINLIDAPDMLALSTEAYNISFLSLADEYKALGFSND